MKTVLVFDGEKYPLEFSSLDRRTIAGVDFEAVRFDKPVKHYRPRVIATGYIYSVGVFDSKSRPKMWESMEYMASRISADRFAREAIEAKN